MRPTLLALGIAFASGVPAAGQAPAMTNPIGMEFVLIRPGTMTVGRFQPTCPPRAAAAPQADPRTVWTEADHRRCEEMVRRQSTAGFEVRIDRHWKAHGDATRELHARFLEAFTQALIARDVFRTLLGPAHRDHADHFHFDMAPHYYVDL